MVERAFGGCLPEGGERRYGEQRPSNDFVRLHDNTSWGRSACGRFYQFRRPPSTMMRLLLALPNAVKRPNVTESILLSRVALEKSGWLVEFRKSARNSKL